MKTVKKFLFLFLVIITSVWVFVIYLNLPSKKIDKNNEKTVMLEDKNTVNIKNDYNKPDNEELNTINIYKELSPAVVNIMFYKTEYIRYFFELYPKKSEGQGSGAIIDPRGYIVTNYHVVGEADKVTVSLSQNEGVFDAKIIGVDPENDLAVIKIDNHSEKFKAIPMGTSNDLQVGQKVYAIGNPFGLDRTLTSGIISGLGRPIKTENNNVIEGAIQTDASINPGNSGGPLIDSSGRMIGINTMIVSPSGGSIGLGFAIPVDTVKEVIDELIKYGYVKRGWIDATFLPMTPYIAKELGYKVNYGVMVMTVKKNGEANKSGLRGGDRKALYGNSVVYIGGEVITSINNVRINDYSTLAKVLKDKKPGEIIDVEYYKNNKKYNTSIKLIDKRKFIGDNR